MAPAERIVQAEVFGDTHLMRTMNSWAFRAGNALPAFEAMHQYTMEIERELFETQGSSGEHGAWEGYTEGSRSDKEGHPILRKTDALFDSLTDPDNTNHRFVVTPFGFAMGTALDYAERHQTGTKWMPQRRIFDFTWPQRMGFVEIMHEWITRAGLQATGQSAGFRVRATRTGRFIG
jgi:hypothetical protein